MSCEAVATEIVTSFVGSQFLGFGVVYTFSPIFRRIRNRRKRAQTKEQLRLLGAVRTVIDQLRKTYDMDAAAAAVEQECFGDCIALTNSYEGLVAAVADRFKAGDNVWDGELVGDDVVRIGFWQDKTHRRVF